MREGGEPRERDTCCVATSHLLLVRSTQLGSRLVISLYHQKTINPRAFSLSRSSTNQTFVFISNSTSFFLCVSCRCRRRPGTRSKNPPVIFSKKTKQRRRRTVYIGRAHLYCADFISTRTEQRGCFDFSPPSSYSLPFIFLVFFFF